ncbi:hypothetical protein V502_00903 [Pseudogymnoascus sp. VKM F-4520 (FW-2644)]|nr:hypothetical protein V502_00903 [Pseudogymnoascus sp. VKM F-4520 (FW-2644)]
MQADNGKEFKGALLILLRKYRIQVVNRALRSPQTQGLVEQANGIVEAKLRAWKMDHGSTEWKDGLLKVTLAMNTQIHSTIGQARKDLSIGVEQEDKTQAPILESELRPEALIDPRLLQPKLNSEPSSGSELNSELGVQAPTQTRARAQIQAASILKFGIELSRFELNSEPSSGSELNSELGVQAPTQTRARMISNTLILELYNITWHESLSRSEREKLRGQRGYTIWFTGLSASGKSTIATALEQHLLHLGVGAYRLDGDNVRFGLNKDLGFSEADRNENIRRIAEVAKLFADASTATLTSFISPYKADRKIARDLHATVAAGDEPIPFIEVYVDIPVEVAEQRDPKGLYKKARAGIIKDFTGISAPYEAPEAPEIHIRSDQISVEDAVVKIVEYLKSKDLLPAAALKN